MAKVRRLNEEVWKQGNFAVINELFTTDYIGGEPSMTIQGQEGVRQFVSQYRSAFPDLHFTIEDMIAEGDNVVTRWSVTGTHEGNLLGIPLLASAQQGPVIPSFASSMGRTRKIGSIGMHWV
jgi:steroid delta-isomerase-like uncharacterized protein